MPEYNDANVQNGAVFLYGGEEVRATIPLGNVIWFENLIADGVAIIHLPGRRSIHVEFNTSLDDFAGFNKFAWAVETALAGERGKDG